MDEPAESLSSGHVELRRWRMSDLNALEQAIRESLDHLMPWMPWAAAHGRQPTVDFLIWSQEEWEARRGFHYAITSSDTVIGSCSLNRRIGAGGLDIGYWLHPQSTGRGLATMATAALVCQGFQMAGIDHLEIHHDAANPASGAVALRLGFTEIERTPVPEGPVAPGEVGIDVVWRMTVDQWSALTSEG
ncbi:GNAT family N-acetyltransferase [Streptomyces sp. NPDC050504]|uniref:GNAT family N-acetyltransferase n=1 Tax=Streptomyces sp. NPDC050504 TaxID=3365618 RepID=UPI00378D8A26